MTGTDLVYAAASLEDRKGYALALSRAGDLVPKGFRDRDGSANPGKILLAAEYGNMLGLHPMAALAGLNIIDGKVSPAPALMSALVRRAGHTLRVRTTGTVKAGTISATVTLIRSDDPNNPFESTWDVDRAKRADLWGKSGSWSKYPEAMLKWRAMSEVCRDGAEDVLLGAHYVPEELGADVNEAGELVDVTATAIDRTREIRDAEIVEQDEDGPNVRKTMRDTIPNRNPGGDTVSGHPNEPSVPHSANEDAIAAPRSGPGGSRTASKPVPGPADQPDPRAKAAVAVEWFERITACDSLPALFKLHEDAARVHVLDHTSNGRTVEDAFLDRRATLQQADAGEPETPPEEEDVPLDALSDLSF